MAQERRIVVAVDEGEESMYALRWCLRHVVADCEGTPDRLILLYAMPPSAIYTSSVDGTGYLFARNVTDAIEQYEREIASSVLARAKNACRHLKNAKVETRAEKGEPKEVITGVTVRAGADMLVMGTRGHGKIKRALLGSVSSHCARKASCPVMVVKKPKEHHP